MTSIQTSVTSMTNKVKGKFEEIRTKASTTFENIRSKVSGVLNTLQSRFSGFASSVSQAFSRVWSKASTVFNNIRSLVNRVVSSVRGSFSGLANSIGTAFGNIYDRVKYWVDRIQEKLRSITAGIANVRSKLPGAKAGALVMGPQTYRVGEAGPEAVIPLTRPLHLVDPSVRDMAATLRGFGSTSGQKPGKVINNTVNVTTKAMDERTVAEQIVNRIAVMAS
jgi:phage-related minor tail protein